MPEVRPDAALLLAWYDRHRRTLPWRSARDQRPDPYRVWLSEIMLQQTTVKAATPYYARFIARWPTLPALAAASREEVLRMWAGLGYYARARNLHACAQAVVERHGGSFPSSEAELRRLPGIGPYTAAAIAAIVFEVPTVPIDGNVERVMARLFAVERDLPAADPEIRGLAVMLAPAERAGDFAQALMDLGATVCLPKQPRCTSCPWTAACAARNRRDPEAFPRKAAKVAGRLRRGAAFVALRRDGSVLVRTRPGNGLLGGMSEVPTTEWSAEFKVGNALADAPLPAAKWRRIPGRVTHSFTHFPLELAIFATKLGMRTRAPADTRWVPASELAGEAFPSVMRKVIGHALGSKALRPHRAHPSRRRTVPGIGQEGCQERRSA